MKKTVVAHHMDLETQSLRNKAMEEGFRSHIFSCKTTSHGQSDVSTDRQAGTSMTFLKGTLNRHNNQDTPVAV